MGIFSPQTNFTKGELDPRLNGRTDLQAYYQSVETATNVRNIPQGGLQKRGGFQFIGEAEGDGRLERFAFNVEQQYLFVFTNLKLQIYRDDVLLDPVDGGVSDFISTPYSLSEIRDLDFIQSADTVIITHPNVAPQIIQRINDNNWTIDAINLIDIPQFDFNDASSPAPTSQIQNMTFLNTTIGDRFKISFQGLLTDEIVYAGGTDATNSQATANNIKDALSALPVLSGDGLAVGWLGVADQFQIVFSLGNSNDWDLMSVTPVISNNSAFSATVTIFQQGVSRREDVWSGARGWPVSCTFHEARLWFGGARSRPSTIWGSVVNDPFNFKQGRGRDDESIEFTLLTDQVNAVTNIISNRALQVFTTGAEFYVPESPVTPSNVAVRPQTNLGSKRVRPVVLEGTTLFLQRTGKALYQFQFVNELQANDSRSLSILAPHLINDPVKMDVERGTSESDANYVYIIPNNGLEMTVFNSNLTEGIQAFTRYTSADDIFESVAVVSDNLYILIKRKEGWFIEKEVLSTNLDSNVVQTGLGGATVITGLDHLNGETVRVKGDGALLEDQLVIGGQITVERPVDDVEVGLDYNPLLVTQPLNLNIQNGPNAAQKKKIMRVGVDYFESNGIIINGERIADKTIGVNAFDAPIPQTRLERVFLHGWSLEAQITITQTTPYPMTILALYTEVKV